ncbi:hypothetical protein PHISP_02700 [Aspergillus sp. HF37]|nr:hypothetical protein PHISP_02700 [Aspergillus sp. HF37]
MSTPDNAFHQLAHILASRRDRILEFEILPRGSGPLLQDGCSVGLSKEALVQSFVAARQIFFKAGTRSPCLYPREETSGRAPRDQDEESESVDIASQILLLFDCEHLSACNYRKRRLASAINAHDFTTASHASHERLVLRLESELTLTTTLLTSRLHRHTKSPTLWQHRLWVMTRVLSVQGLDPTDRLMGQGLGPLNPNPPSLETIRELFVAEADVVLCAGELHPKNYYAFSYLRELHGLLAEFVRGGGGDEDGDGLEALATSVVTPVLEWCLAHPRDISGWMFVLYLLEAVHDDRARADVVSRTVRFASGVGWEGESLWTFVDMAAKSFGVVDSVQDMIRSQPSAASDSIVGSVSEDVLPDKPWKVWVVKVRAYWAAGGL